MGDAGTTDVVNTPQTAKGNTSDLTSEAPVRYFDGVVSMVMPDLASFGFGTPWGQTRSWTNGPGYATQGVNGNGVVDSEIPYLLRMDDAGNTVVAIANPDTITESYLYTYASSGPNAGLLESVTLRRQTNAGPWSTVRSIDYAYYDGVEANGNRGDLKTAILRDSAGGVIDTSYFRY